MAAVCKPYEPPSKRAKVVPLAFMEGFEAYCPCCFKPGDPFCDSCEPEDAKQKLEGLRTILKARGLDAYVVLAQDAHASEYIAKADERRSWLTGFSGSAGTALVTRDEALLWTDSRYFLQAEKQLAGTEWQLMRQFNPGVPELREWVLSNLQGKTLGLDPRLVAFEALEEWRKAWGEKVKVEAVEENLVDAIWTGKPADPSCELRVHPLEWAGKSVQEKLGELRDTLTGKGAGAVLVSALDQIAWLFNLRGADIDCNPVFLAYAAVTKERAAIFVRGLDEGEDGLPAEVRDHLESSTVEVLPYRRFFDEAATIVKDLLVLVEPSTCSARLMSIVPPGLRVCCDISPVELAKACKNATEMEGIRKCAQRDSGAICEFLSQIEARVRDPTKPPLDEAAASDMIHETRKRKEHFVGDSFPTISSVGSNAAIIHYRPVPGACKALGTKEVYLCDTGAQYLDGTTDVTRTVHLGTPTAEERRCYTRVLQGHIALASAVFPEETPGIMLDALARQFLWQEGCAYGHGTGHGMGAYMNVHEGPFGIGGGNVSAGTVMKSEARLRKFMEPFRLGNFVSNEPGCYKDGAFGIRIECDMLVVPASPPMNVSATRPWVKFDTVTLVPMCRELIEVELLAARELQWLNDYHARVRAALAGKLHDKVAEDWLQRNTEPIAAASCTSKC